MKTFRHQEKKTKVHWPTIAKQSRSFKNLHKFRKKWDSVQDQVPNFHLLSLLKLLKLVEIQSIFKWVTFQLSNFDYFSLNQQKVIFTQNLNLVAKLTFEYVCLLYESWVTLHESVIYRKQNRSSRQPEKKHKNHDWLKDDDNRKQIPKVLEFVNVRERKNTL